MYESKVNKPSVESYTDVAGILYASIFAGTYPPHYRLPSLREMSKMYGVSVATIARGVTEVEKRGLITLSKGHRRVVTEDRGLIQKAKDEYIAKSMKAMIDGLHTLGYRDCEIVKLISDYSKE